MEIEVGSDEYGRITYVLPPVLARNIENINDFSSGYKKNVTAIMESAFLHILKAAYISFLKNEGNSNYTLDVFQHMQKVCQLIIKEVEETSQGFKSPLEPEENLEEELSSSVKDFLKKLDF